jgi:hypothetical protein
MLCPETTSLPHSFHHPTPSHSISPSTSSPHHHITPRHSHPYLGVCLRTVQYTPKDPSKEKILIPPIDPCTSPAALRSTYYIPTTHPSIHPSIHNTYKHSCKPVHVRTSSAPKILPANPPSSSSLLLPPSKRPELGWLTRLASLRCIICPCRFHLKYLGNNIDPSLPHRSSFKTIRSFSQSKLVGSPVRKGESSDVRLPMFKRERVCVKRGRSPKPERAMTGDMKQDDNTQAGYKHVGLDV